MRLLRERTLRFSVQTININSLGRDKRGGWKIFQNLELMGVRIFLIILKLVKNV